jgi:hypothetical protein
MTKFASRDQVTAAVLGILTPEYTEEDLHRSNITWWQNFRRTGGFALTVKGTEAFKDAGIEYQEYEIGPAGVVTGMGHQSTLAAKMVVPYYFYINERTMRVKIYDSRASMMVVLYDTVQEYLASLPNRDK